MKKIIYLAAGVALLSLGSCSKDKNDKPDPGNGGERKLVKMTKTENGQETIYNLSYTAGNKLQSVISTDNNESTVFTYDNEGKLIKVEESDSDFKNIYTYTYQGGLPSTGTFKSWQKTAGEPDELIEDDQLEYTLTGNQVTKIKTIFGLNEGASADFVLSYQNGNLAKVAVDGIYHYEALFTYGTNKPVMPPVSTFVLDHAGFSLQFVSKNEIKTASWDFDGTEMDYEITNTYTYDANGYVLTSSDGDATIKYDYQ
ncbi:hypothetical protein [Flavihumibacter petaseus]|uniref:DUF4595 domain-containing protein n=1 Tax=Flavihumibacter petaseus NBRC 106054 TaxID=1220578 RepID=A0A0E9MUG4_9BACT|nr:hypothetical protein [Flavihumibacter petaseus]GAO41061.1 hypothetical protein FPE01S_01_00730 [Flavihumibacter petaseus NBRC 106054]